MRNQVTLLPTESKKLIAKALANIEEVKGAKMSRKFRQTDCTKCKDEHCSLRGGTRPWLKN
jgi:hypothetical protein